MGLLQNVSFCNNPLKNRLRAIECGPPFRFINAKLRFSVSMYIRVLCDTPGVVPDI